VENAGPTNCESSCEDFVIERAPYKMGFVVRVPSRFGQARHSWLLRQMRTDDISIILEQWPPRRSL